jgi:hypothetical protein
MTATTERCPGCHGSGIEMSGVTYAGMSEYVGCHECGPECPDDCGCRASDATERPESIALCHPGATQSPDGSPSATEVLRGPEGASDVRSVSPARDAELVAYEAAAAAAYEAGLLGGMSREERAARHAALARGAVSDAEAAQWAALADAATEGPWVVDSDGSIGAPMAGFACGEDGHPRLDCPDCGLRVGGSNSDDTAFIATARTAVPRLLADRERLTAENARMRQVAELRVGTWRDTAARLGGERDRARGTAATLEAENARLREGIEALADQWEADPSNDRTAGPPQPEDYGMDLRALLAEGGE